MHSGRISSIATAESASVLRVGVIGDVHGRVDLAQRAVTALRAAQVDCIVCVGDIVGGTEDTEALCALFLTEQVRTVRGNHDRWFVEDVSAGRTTSLSSSSMEFLTNLPACFLLPTNGGNLLVGHGFGGHDLSSVPCHFPRSFLNRARRLKIVPENCVAIIGGHVHLRRVQSVDNLMIITAGNLDDEGRGGCVVYDAQSSAVSFLSY